MNRRNFIASLVALPAGLVAAAKAASAPSVVGGLNLDLIFKQLYEIKITRSAQQVLFVEPEDIVTLTYRLP